MKNILFSSLLIFSLIVSSAVSAALYKGLDDEGNVVYSDTPFDEAEKFTPPPISVMEKPKGEIESEALDEKKSAEFKYLSFDITSPKNNETIRNAPAVVVTLDLKPGLNTEANHGIWMLVDGETAAKNSQSLTFELSRLDRGAHKLQGQVRDQNGKIVLRTRTTVVFVHHTSAP